MKTVSEGPLKITKSTIEAAWKRRGPDQRLIIRDKERRGLALIVNATGWRWEFSYRPRGIDPATGGRWKNKTLTLGDPGETSIDQARAAVDKAKTERRDGRDPVDAKKTKEAEAQRQRAATCGRLADDYGKALPERPKMRGDGGRPSAAYVAGEMTQLRLAILGIEANDKPVAALSEADMRRVVRQINAKARFGAMSRFLEWCIEEKHLATNPTSLLVRGSRPRARKPRTRYLDAAELARLWHAADQYKLSVWRDYARFMIAIPCRRGEAARMDWSHVNLAAGEWRQPEHLTKNGDPHRLYLHPLAKEVLEARRRAWAEDQANGDMREAERLLAAGLPRTGLVFESPKVKGILQNFTDLKTALTDATAGDDDAPEKLDGWTWHDLRRSFATALGEAGISETVADAVLNHRQSQSRGGVLGVYQRSSRWPEQVKAMEAWGRMLTAAIRGESEAKVISLLTRSVS